MYCIEVLRKKLTKTAIDMNTIEIKRLKLLTCILFIPQAKIIAAIITIINQWLGRPKKIFFMIEPLS